MGSEGRSYREILAFYYPGTSPGTTGQGLTWSRLGGEALAVFSTRPDQDRGLLTMAEMQVREIQKRTGWQAVRGIEIRVYPDLDTFRNATGEPGWVAAHTMGTRIQLQPAATLRSRNALEIHVAARVVARVRRGARDRWLAGVVPGRAWRAIWRIPM